MVYLVVGRWRIPWNFRVLSVKGTTSPATLGLKMVKSLPKKLTNHFEVMVLVDTGFGSVQFLQGVRKKKYHIIAGIACTRKLIDGRPRCSITQARTTALPSGFEVSRLKFLVLF